MPIIYITSFGLYKDSIHAGTAIFSILQMGWQTEREEMAAWGQLIRGIAGIWILVFSSTTPRCHLGVLKERGFHILTKWEVFRWPMATYACANVKSAGDVVSQGPPWSQGSLRVWLVEDPGLSLRTSQSIGWIWCQTGFVRPHFTLWHENTMELSKCQGAMCQRSWRLQASAAIPRK